MLFLIDLFWRLKQKYVFHFEFASKIDLWISGGGKLLVFNILQLVKNS